LNRTLLTCQRQRLSQHVSQDFLLQELLAQGRVGAQLVCIPRNDYGRQDMNQTGKKKRQGGNSSGGGEEKKKGGNAKDMMDLMGGGGRKKHESSPLSQGGMDHEDGDRKDAGGERKDAA